MKVRKLNWSKKRLLLASVILLAVAGWLLLKFVSKPSEGAISYPDSSDSAKTAGESYTRYDGQNISFAYPENYRFEVRTANTDAVSESYFLVAPPKDRNPSYTVGVSVYKLPGSNPNENSSYRIRSQAPQAYKRTVEMIDDRQAIYFKNLTANENTVFIQDGSKLAAIGISGSGYNSKTEQDFRRLVSSIEWL